MDRDLAEIVLFIGPRPRTSYDDPTSSTRRRSTPYHSHSFTAERVTVRYLSFRLYDYRQTSTTHSYRIQGTTPHTTKFSETPKFSTSAATMLSLVCKRCSPRRPIEQNPSFLDAVRWADTCLTRSDPLPVSISICTGDPMAMISLAQLINNNGQRIRELYHLWSPDEVGYA